MSTYAQRRCHNHEERQAACRCPACGLDFCRECVTEHDERLLCACCMLPSAMPREYARWRALQSFGFCMAGLLAAWMFFFLAGELASMVLAPQHEVPTWHAR